MNHQYNQGDMIQYRQRWIDEGCLFVTAGADFVWVVDKARETLKALGR